VVVRRIELYQSEEGDSFTHMKRLQSGFKKITSQLLELDKHVVLVGYDVGQPANKRIKMLLNISLLVHLFSLVATIVSWKGGCLLFTNACFEAHDRPQSTKSFIYSFYRPTITGDRNRFYDATLPLFLPADRRIIAGGDWNTTLSDADIVGPAAANGAASTRLVGRAQLQQLEPVQKPPLQPVLAHLHLGLVQEFLQQQVFQSALLAKHLSVPLVLSKF
jgi:hypothetical protein